MHLKKQSKKLYYPLAFSIFAIINISPISLAIAHTLPSIKSDPKAEFSNYLFQNKNPNVRTDSAIVIQRGYILFEEYRNNNPQLHKIWSISKAFTNALIGIAIQEEKLQLDNSICEFYKYLTTNKCKITIRHLLQWSSGLAWTEDYSVSPESSNVLQMLYGDGAADMAKYALRRPLKFEAGNFWNYSSGDTLILMGILKKIYAKEYLELPKNKLFQPLGITHTVFEKDESGTFLGASHAFSKVRDLAKFGQLFLNDGLVKIPPGSINSKLYRLLPLGWVQFSTQVSEAYANSDSLEPGSWGQKHPAGAGWWVNANLPLRNKSEPWPSVPSDTFAARGFRGQFLFVIPQLNMIVVRLGFDLNDTDFDADQMLSLAKKLILSGDSKKELL